MKTFYFKTIKDSKLDSGIILVDSSVKITASESHIKLEISFPCVVNFYYKINSNQLEISNDIRFLYESDSINSRGILSLLLLGAVVPPLSPFEGIVTFIPGRTYEISIHNFEIKSQPFVKWSPFSIGDKQMGIQEQARILTDVLDRQLITLCPERNPIILFSGGVDSSVLAQRVSAMGWDETILFHSSFGQDDEETDIARKINSHYKLNLDVHHWEIEDGFECLEKSASLYAQPFCDHSSVPTHSLSKAAAYRYGEGRVILDGTGADGAFGLFKKAKKYFHLYRLHQALRGSAGGLYEYLRMWNKKNIIEYYLRVLGRSAVLSELTNSIAQSPLVNIAFMAKKSDIEIVDACCIDWIRSVSQTSDIEEQIPLLDIGLVCSGIFAQKNKRPLLDYGIQVEYPFLSPDIVDLALGHTRFWPGSKVEKNTLKYILEKAVSRELVYRKKSGFVAPLVEQFSHPVMLKYLYFSTETNSPLFEILNQRVLTKMIEYVKTKRELPTQTYTFLWGVAFINSWLSQVGDVSAKLREDKLQHGFMQ